MRPRTQTTRRARSRLSAHDLLESVARIVDEGAAGDDHHLLVHVLRGDPTDEALDLGVLPLERGTHPFTALAGFRAPPDWSVFGIRAVGTARDLDEPGGAGRRCATTLLLDRDGREVALLRTGEEVRLLPGPMDGTIPDACRRALGLPTAPPPSSSAGLWTVLWLDRVLAAWSDPSTRRSVTSGWAALARLHPAANHESDDLDVPASLVRLARAHAEAWPWARLRAHPEAAPAPGPCLPASVTQWMDDGFYARWTIGAFPSIGQLGTDLPALLGAPLGPQLAAVALELLD